MGIEKRNYHGPSKAQLKEMSTYVSELLMNDRESYDALIDVLKYLTE